MLADLLVPAGTGAPDSEGAEEIYQPELPLTNRKRGGPGPPAFPTFPLSKGLTSSAIANRMTVNEGDVVSDPRYLTAFGSTRSELIIPVFDEAKEFVVCTIDVESEQPHYFDRGIQQILEACATAKHASG